VAAVMEGSNGEAGGIQEGYFLVSVNGIDVQEKEFDDIMSVIGDADESKSLELVFRAELPPGAKELFPLSPNSDTDGGGGERQKQKHAIIETDEKEVGTGEEVIQVISPKRKYRVVLDKLPLLILPAGATRRASSLVEVVDGRHVDFGSIVHVSLLLHSGKQVYAEFCHEFEGAEHAPTGWLLAQEGEHLNITCDEFVVQTKTPPPPVTPPKIDVGKKPAPLASAVKTYGSEEEDDEEAEEVDYHGSSSGGSFFDNFDISSIFACCNLVVAKPASQEETQLQNKKLAEEYEHMKFLKTEKKKKAKREEKQKRRARDTFNDDTSFASWDPHV